MSEKEVMKMEKSEKVIYTIWISIFVIMFLMLMTLTSKGGWFLMLLSIILVLPSKKIKIYQKFNFLKPIRYRVIFAIFLLFITMVGFQLTNFKVDVDPVYTTTEKNQAEIKITIVHGKENVVKIGEKEVKKTANGIFLYKSTLKEGENKFVFKVTSTNTDNQKIEEEVQSTIFYLTEKLKAKQKIEEKQEELEVEKEQALKNCKENPEKALKIKNHSWKTINYGMIYQHSIQLKNPCNIAFKDFEFKIKYFGSSGSEIHSINTGIVYNYIKPKSTKWLKVKGDEAVTGSSKQYKSARVEIIDAKIKK